MKFDSSSLTVIILNKEWIGDRIVVMLNKKDHNRQEVTKITNLQEKNKPQEIISLQKYQFSKKIINLQENYQSLTEKQSQYQESKRTINQAYIN